MTLNKDVFKFNQFDSCIIQSQTQSWNSLNYANSVRFSINAFVVRATERQLESKVKRLF